MVVGVCGWLWLVMVVVGYGCGSCGFGDWLWLGVLVPTPCLFFPIAIVLVFSVHFQHT